MKELNYNIFRRRLADRSKKNKFPLRAMFELTYTCNFNCVHCYIPPKRKEEKELDTKQVILILDQLRDLGCLYLGFTGGEIFLRRDIWDILWYAKQRGFINILLTNGSLINKKAADELSKIDSNKIDITLHSMNNRHFENITRKKGSFKKVMRAIELLRQRRIPLGIKNCLLRENRNDMEGVRQFGAKIGAVTRLGSSVGPRIDGNSDPLSYCFQRNPKFKKLTNKLLVAGVNSRRLKKRNVFECGAGTQSLTISPQGKIKLCQTIDYPKLDILELGLRAAWGFLNSIILEIESKNDLPCDRCGMYGYCTWCPEKSWLKFGNFIQCDEKIKQKVSQ